MSKFKVGKKMNSLESSISYVALKSQDEIYYQMASIFKAVNKDKEKLARKIFKGVLTGEQSGIVLENSL